MTAKRFGNKWLCATCQELEQLPGRHVHTTECGCGVARICDHLAMCIPCELTGCASYRLKVSLSDMAKDAEGVRYVSATVDGARYEIPELWLIGACSALFDSPEAAIRHWHEQAIMGREREAASFARGWEEGVQQGKRMATPDRKG